MEIKRLDIKYLKNNTGQIKGLPKNPRILKDEKFNKLVKSIQDNPEMLDLRELIVYDNNGEMIVICGNMRLKAMKELKYKDAPCKVLSTDTDVEKLKAYTIKDNVSFGENDWEMIANEWDAKKLEEWGLDLPDFSTDEILEDEQKDLSSNIENLYRIEVICKDEEHQETTYNKLIEQGYECRLLTL
jgi:hypothetical protein